MRASFLKRSLWGARLRSLSHRHARLRSDIAEASGCCPVWHLDRNHRSVEYGRNHCFRLWRRQHPIHRGARARAMRISWCERCGACSASTSCWAGRLPRSRGCWRLSQSATWWAPRPAAGSLSPGAADCQRSDAGAGGRERLRQHAKSLRTIWSGDPYQPPGQNDHSGSSRGAQHARIWCRPHHGGDCLLHGSWNRGSAYPPAAISGCGSLWPSFDRHATSALFGSGRLAGCLRSPASSLPRRTGCSLASRWARRRSRPTRCVCRWRSRFMGSRPPGSIFCFLTFRAKYGLSAGSDQESDSGGLRGQLSDRGCRNRSAAALRPCRS